MSRVFFPCRCFRTSVRADEHGGRPDVDHVLQGLKPSNSVDIHQLPWWAGPMPCWLWSSTLVSGQARIGFTFLGWQWGSQRWRFHWFLQKPWSLIINSRNIEKMKNISVLPLFARSEFEFDGSLLGTFQWNDHSSNHRTSRAFEMNAAPWVAESWLFCHSEPLLFVIRFK